MAGSASNALQTLPRFLLPRLSWIGPTGSSQVFRASLHPLENRRIWQGYGTALASFHSCRDAHMFPSVKPSARPSLLLQNPALRRSFHATVPRGRDHHFDTLKFVQRLQSEGFTEEQSVAMMKVLNDVIQERQATFNANIWQMPPLTGRIVFKT